jgi:hypothetical protein
MRDRLREIDHQLMQCRMELARLGPEFPSKWHEERHNDIVYARTELTNRLAGTGVTVFPDQYQTDRTVFDNSDKKRFVWLCDVSDTTAQRWAFLTGDPRYSAQWKWKREGPIGQRADAEAFVEAAFNWLINDIPNA